MERVVACFISGHHFQWFYEPTQKNYFVKIPTSLCLTKLELFNYEIPLATLKIMKNYSNSTRFYLVKDFQRLARSLLDCLFAFTIVIESQ